MRPTTTSHGLQPTLDNERRYEPPALIEIGGVYELTLNGGGGDEDDDDGGGGHHSFCFRGKTFHGSDGFSFTIPIPPSGPANDITITLGSC